MASGVIIGDCDICNEYIYEDQMFSFEYLGKKMYHDECVKNHPHVKIEVYNHNIKDEIEELEFQMKVIIDRIEALKKRVIKCKQ